MEAVDKILCDINKSIQELENLDRSGMLLNKVELSSAYTIRGLFYFRINMFEKCIIDVGKSIEILERMDCEGKQFDKNEYAKAHASRGMAYHAVGAHTQALQDFSKSIEVWECLQNSGEPIERSFLFNMYVSRAGMFNYNQEHMGDALSDYHKAIKMAEDQTGTGESFNKDDLADIYMGIAQTYDQKEDYVEANKYYNKCIYIWKKMKNTGQILLCESNLATAHMNRGANFSQTGDNNKALADYNECISIMERLQNEGVAQDIFKMFMVYENRALIHKAEGNIKIAVDDKIKALSILKTIFNERSEVQEFYFTSLFQVLGSIADESDETFLNSILQEFLYSMHPETNEAKEIQRDIFDWLDE